jgi:ABC-type transport system involved in multi-copper enzyme maturation permease subunit
MGLLRADLYKLARHALFRGLAMALLALVLLRGLVWPPDPSLPWAGLWSANLVAAAVIALTAVTVGMEFSEDTFRSLTSRGVPRWGLLLSKFVALVLAGGILLTGVEGLATLLGVRSELRWVELWRAWLSLWPYVGFIMLLTVLARNGGLALVVGVLWLALEQFAGLLMAPLVMLADVPQLGFMRLKDFWASCTSGPCLTTAQTGPTWPSGNERRYR